MSASVYTVGQINRYIRGMFSQDILLSSVRVRGEVSNCKYHTSGHIFFSLKDATGTINCIMFAGNRRGMDFRMADGDKVIADGSIEVYERDGRYQLYAKKISREGAGELYERFVRLKKELAEMGMFDPRYKKPVPKYAKRIGIVTAPTGAAIRDIINISTRRNPYIQIILYPAVVQGDGAAASICEGIRKLDRYGVDVIIIGRGGGSLEDLWAFNEESVAEAVFECGTPIISAVGHETDTVISDYVADLRAPTPSAAAELAVFSYEQFQSDLDAFERRLRGSMENRIFHLRRSTESLRRELAHLSPASRIRDRRMFAAQCEEKLNASMARRIDICRRKADQSERLQSRMDRKLTDAHNQMRLYAAGLEQRSPLVKLSGGYGYVSDGSGRTVVSVDRVRTGDILNVQLRDGRLETEVKSVHPGDAKRKA